MSRAIALDMNIPAVAKRHWKDKNSAVLRGKDYNHSSYCDLIISGLVGLEINEDGNIVVNPLLPSRSWDWFCLDHVKYHDKILTIVWDKNGQKYQQAKGFSIYINGQLQHKSSKLEKAFINLKN